MNYKVKGIITAIGDIKTTKLGTAVQIVHVEQDISGRIFYPQCLGTKIELLNDFLPGDIVEIKFHISGSKGQFNNVVVDDMKRI